MGTRRLAALLATAAIATSACAQAGVSPSAQATQAPASSAAAASEEPTASASEPAESASGSAATGDCTVGVSWNNFQQPRWAATDQPNMKETIEAAGGTMLEFDANLDSNQQLTDVETLISQGAQVLVLLAQNQDAILPAVERAKEEGIPVIAYDRLIEDPEVLYITFDNVDVGRA